MDSLESDLHSLKCELEKGDALNFNEKFRTSTPNFDENAHAVLEILFARLNTQETLCTLKILARNEKICALMENFPIQNVNLSLESGLMFANNLLMNSNLKVREWMLPVLLQDANCENSEPLHKLIFICCAHGAQKGALEVLIRTLKHLQYSNPREADIYAMRSMHAIYSRNQILPNESLPNANLVHDSNENLRECVQIAALALSKNSDELSISAAQFLHCVNLETNLDLLNESLANSILEVLERCIPRCRNEELCPLFLLCKETLRLSKEAAEVYVRKCLPTESHRTAPLLNGSGLPSALIRLISPFFQRKYQFYAGDFLLHLFREDLEQMCASLGYGNVIGYASSTNRNIDTTFLSKKHFSPSGREVDPMSGMLKD